MSTSTKAKLIEATRELLWERGFEGTSPAAILERSGVGQGSLYHHFGGKADVASAAMGENARIFVPRVAEQLELAPGASAVDRLSAYLSAPRDALLGCRFGRLANEPSVLANDDVLEPIRTYFDGVAELLIRVIREGQVDGELSGAIAAEDLAALVLAVVQGGFVLARVYADPARMERALHAAIALLRSYAVDGGAR